MIHAYDCSAVEVLEWLNRRRKDFVECRWLSVSEGVATAGEAVSDLEHWNTPIIFPNQLHYVVSITLSFHIRGSAKRAKPILAADLFCTTSMLSPRLDQIQTWIHNVKLEFQSEIPLFITLSLAPQLGSGSEKETDSTNLKTHSWSLNACLIHPLLIDLIFFAVS